MFIKQSKIRACLLSAAILSLFCIPAKAQQDEQELTEVSLSLNQAREMAVERNLTLQNASLDVKAAQASKWAAIAKMLPQVSGKADYSDYCGYKMDFGGMQIAMPPYINMSVSTSVAFSGAMVVNAKINDISLKMSDITLKKTEQDVSNQVKTLYYSALVTEQIADLLEQNLKSLDKLYQMTCKSVEVGVAEQTAADQIQVQMATLANSISSTRRSIEMVYNSLRLQLNVPADCEIHLTDRLDDIMAIDDFLHLVNDEFIVENNYNYQLVAENTKLSKQQYNIAKLAYAPTLSAYHNFTSKEYLTDESTMNMTPPNMIGISLSIPIFSSFDRYNTMKAARLSYTKQLNTQSDTERQLMIQHRQLCFNLTNAYETYQTQKANLDVTQRVFDNIAAKYEHGYSSAMDLTNTTTTLIGAQSTYVQAILEFVNAQIELEKLLNK